MSQDGGWGELAREAVDGLEAIAGTHEGHRRAHAKGTLCQGSFRASAQAADVSRAAHFQGEPVRCHVRFSNGSGDPSAPDYDARDGRGIGVKFYLPDGTTADVVGLSLPVFFVRDPKAFLEFVRARTPDPETGELDMEKVAAFLGAHPEALPAAQAVLESKPPESYLRTAYNSLHAFGFVSERGAVRHGRYRFEPEAGVAPLEPEAAEAKGADYLQADLAERLEAGTARFTVWLQLAADGDPLDDPTVAWPDERERVEIGRLEITGLAFDRERDDDVLVFDPTRVTDGIELTDDAILHFRAHAYAESVMRRSGLARG